MKKIFSVICLTAVLLTSCKKDGEGFVVRPWTLEQEIAYNMDYFSQQHSEADNNVYFYEVQCVLNGKLAELDAKDVRIQSSLTVANVGRFCHQISTDFVSGIRQTNIIPGTWAGSFTIDNPTALKISFDQAVELIKNAKDIQTPNSNKMTLRHPLGTTINPLYIFGSTSEGLYVSVDAMTGEVAYFN